MSVLPPLDSYCLYSTCVCLFLSRYILDLLALCVIIEGLNLAQRHVNSTPECPLLPYVIPPLYTRGCFQHGHHRWCHPTLDDVIDTHNEQTVVVVQNVRQAVRKLKLTPLTVYKVTREDHEDFFAALNACWYVLYDGRTGDEVSLVQAQSVERKDELIILLLSGVCVVSQSVEGKEQWKKKTILKISLY